MEAQGCKVEDNILHQDSESSILLEKNGKASSSKRTKRVNVCHFFVADRLNKNKLSAVWCPTGNMIGNYATKSLQGLTSEKFRDHIMGVARAEDPGSGKWKPVGSNSIRRPGKQSTVW